MAGCFPKGIIRPGPRRLQVDNCRVIYTILEDEVLVLRIGHRREVYR
jgi:mRNA-degrading endonuclease RelE of RelBE toxin-antitoxin system